MWVTFFSKKGRSLYLFHLCHILPRVATLVILGRIIDGKKTLLARTIQRTYGVMGPYLDCKYTVKWHSSRWLLKANDSCVICYPNTLLHIDVLFKSHLAWAFFQF